MIDPQSYSGSTRALACSGGRLVRRLFDAEARRTAPVGGYAPHFVIALALQARLPGEAFAGDGPSWGKRRQPPSSAVKPGQGGL